MGLFGLYGIIVLHKRNTTFRNIAKLGFAASVFAVVYFYTEFYLKVLLLMGLPQPMNQKIIDLYTKKDREALSKSFSARSDKNQWKDNEFNLQREEEDKKEEPSTSETNQIGQANESETNHSAETQERAAAENDEESGRLYLDPVPPIPQPLERAHGFSQPDQLTNPHLGQQEPHHELGTSQDSLLEMSPSGEFVLTPRIFVYKVHVAMDDLEWIYLWVRPPQEYKTFFKGSPLALALPFSEHLSGALQQAMNASPYGFEMLLRPSTGSSGGAGEFVLPQEGEAPLRDFGSWGSSSPWNNQRGFDIEIPEQILPKKDSAPRSVL
jgi:hypothetical protein